MKLLGAMLVLIACGGAGTLAVQELEHRIRRLREAEELTLQMRREVCTHRLPLPEVIALLAEERPGRFAGTETLGEALADMPFAALWRTMMRTLGLPPEAERAMISLGEELSAGSPPEETFERCLSSLGTCLAQARESKEKNARLYLAASFAAGSLLVIVLL